MKFTSIIFTLLFLCSHFTNAQLSDLLWQRDLGDNTVLYKIKPTKDGGYVCVGGSGTAIVIKLDDTGAIVWNRSYGGTGYEHFSEVLETEDGGYILAGITQSDDGDVMGFHTPLTDPQDNDIWVLKIDSIGDIEWSQCYGSSGNEMLAKDAPSMAYGSQGDLLVATPDGGYALLGTTSRPDTLGDVTGYHGHVNNAYFTNKAGDLWLFKINNLGVLQWQKCIGGSINEEPGALLLDDNGGFIIGATTSSSDGDAAGSGYHGS